MLFVNYRHKRFFGDDLRIKIDSFSELAAFSIQNTRLIEALKDNARGSFLWEEFGKKLVEKSELEISQILELIYVEVKKAINIDNFFVATYHEQDDLVQFPFIIESHQQGEKVFQSRIDGRGLTEYVIKTKELLYLREGYQDTSPLMDDDGIEYVEVGDAAKSWLGIPMCTPGKHVLGVMCVQDFENTHAFEKHHIERLSIIATHGANILHLSHLYQDLKIQEQETKSLNKTIKDISIEGDRDGKLRSIIEQATLLLGAEGGKIYYKLPRENILELIASIGLEGQDYKEGTRLNFGEGMAGRVIENKSPLRIPNYEQYIGKLQEISTKFGAVIEVPIMLGDVAIGVLGIFDRKPQRVFNKADEPVLERFSDLAAWVIREWEESKMKKLFDFEQATALSDEELDEFSKEEIAELGYLISQLKVRTESTMNLLEDSERRWTQSQNKINHLINRLEEIS